MQFYSENNLTLLWIIPVATLVFYAVEKRKHYLKSLFAEHQTLARIAVDYSNKKARLKKLLILLTLLCVALALARPQWGEETKTFTRRGIHLIFMVDTSLSMLAEDLKPNRIEFAKRSIHRFTEHLKGDQLGLVAFAGSAFLQVPLTLDYAAFRLFMDALDVGLIPDPGTSFWEPIQRSINAFGEDEDDRRVIIIYSDGESHQGDKDRLIQLLKDHKVRVYAVGVGTKKGGPIPLRSETKTLSAYKKDKQGEIVITQLNDQLLRELAVASGGLYYPATPSGKEIKLIYDDIQAIEKKELSERQLVQREDHFQLFLIVALIFLALDMLISERKAIRQT